MPDVGSPIYINNKQELLDDLMRLKDQERLYAAAFDEIISYLNNTPAEVKMSKELFDGHYVNCFGQQQISFTSLISSVLDTAKNSKRKDWVGEPMEAIVRLSSQLGIPEAKATSESKKHVERFLQDRTDNSTQPHR